LDRVAGFQSFERHDDCATVFVRQRFAQRETHRETESSQVRYQSSQVSSAFVWVSSSGLSCVFCFLVQGLILFFNKFVVRCVPALLISSRTCAEEVRGTLVSGDVGGERRCRILG
jgi:hypothetical protein